MEWIKDLHISILAFNITQFFPSLNHQLLLKILNKAEFDPRITTFFSNYLVNRKIQYIWNNFTSPFFKANISVGQGSALSLILFALYIAPIFYIFKKRINCFLLSISVSTLFFVENSFFHFSGKKL